jgi:hypothetical protein
MRSVYNDVYGIVKSSSSVYELTTVLSVDVQEEIEYDLSKYIRMSKHLTLKAQGIHRTNMG